MKGIFTTPSLTIAAGQAVTGITKRNETLYVRKGRVWITMAGIQHDYWLSAGDNIRTIPGRTIVIEADKVESSIDIVPAAKRSTTLKLLLCELRSRFSHQIRH